MCTRVLRGLRTFVRFCSAPINLNPAPHPQELENFTRFRRLPTRAENLALFANFHNLAIFRSGLAADILCDLLDFLKYFWKLADFRPNVHVVPHYGI